MSDDITLQQLLEVQAHFGLPNQALVEKEVHVVKALAAIAAVETAPLQLVFGGGMALSRAHRLIGRTSEDIDLKIVGDEEPSRTALRRLREAMTDALLRAGFRFDPGDPAQRKSANESRYTIYRLPYEPLSRGEGALRPEIQSEAAVWPLRRPALTLPVSSFVAEALKRPPEVASIACVSITQTAAEKFVALTRRTGAEMAEAGGPRESDARAPHLRFACDPCALRCGRSWRPGTRDHASRCRDLRQPVSHLSRGPVGRDTARGPLDPRYARRYAEFQRDMVYGDVLAYTDALVTISALAENLQEH